jgi:Ni/Co efflux regulator RcnB
MSHLMKVRKQILLLRFFANPLSNKDKDDKETTTKKKERERDKENEQRQQQKRQQQRTQEAPIGRERVMKRKEK